MFRKKHEKETRDSTRASVKAELAKPRMAKSARIAELKLDTARIPEKPSTTFPGVVDRIVRSPRANLPEKAHVAINGPDRGYSDLRFDNTLTDENGDGVKLKKGAHVDVTVTANDAKSRT
jgi:hypothetical protein